MEESEVPAYLEWRKHNPGGFVLNFNTWTPTSPMTNIIHSAKRCQSLDSPPLKNRDNPITSDHPKLCSTDIQDLIDRMELKGLPYKLCGRCLEVHTGSLK